MDWMPVWKLTDRISQGVRLLLKACHVLRIRKYHLGLFRLSLGNEYHNFCSFNLSSFGMEPRNGLDASLEID